MIRKYLVDSFKMFEKWVTLKFLHKFNNDNNNATEIIKAQLFL
jgi:hypothetical protein